MCSQLSSDYKKSPLRERHLLYIFVAHVYQLTRIGRVFRLAMVLSVKRHYLLCIMTTTRPCRWRNLERCQNGQLAACQLELARVF